VDQRDGHHWKPNERRESGEDKRGFAEEIKQDWPDLTYAVRRFGCRMIPCAEAGGRTWNTLIAEFQNMCIVYIC